MQAHNTRNVIRGSRKLHLFSVLQAAADDWRLKLAYPLLMLLDFLLARRRIAQYFFDKFRDPKNLKAVLARVYGDPALVDDALVDMIYTPSSEAPITPKP